MEPNDLRECGQRVLDLFRQQQLAQHGNRGCKCANCQADMVAAVEKLVGEGLFLIEKRPSA